MNSVFSKDPDPVPVERNGVLFRDSKTSSLTFQTPRAEGDPSLMSVTSPAKKNPIKGFFVESVLSQTFKRGPDTLNPIRLYP